MVLPIQKVLEEEEEEGAVEEVRALVERCKPSLHDELRLLQASSCSNHSPEVTLAIPVELGPTCEG